MRTGATFTDVTGPKEEVTVKEIEEQDDWESRRLWRWVAKGIRDGNFDTASKEKSKIGVRVIVVSSRKPSGSRAADRWVQNEQRQRRRDEVAGTSWEPKHFDHIDSDPICKFLSPLPPCVLD